MKYFYDTVWNLPLLKIVQVFSPFAAHLNNSTIPTLFQQCQELLAGNVLNHWRSVPTSTWSEAHGHLSS